MALILSGDTGVPASGMPTGSVIQTVTYTENTIETSTSSTSFQPAVLAATITPTATTSKILILVSTQATNTTMGNDCQLTIYRNGTTNLAGGTYAALGLYRGRTSGTGYVGEQAHISFLDSPATTSATQYKIYLRTDAAGTAYVSFNGFTSSITLMEIKG